ncbi:hypothetical protein LPMP_331960 [Leishmania panamensis]|uniref:Uncharacterized protein n=1 Tax=Leishmania panamensis TaxID=5679 RepID=A0A088SI32_LEIPA|nr:hypothetical protein LPMP_331960 [Leishmania panamensis]AIO01487.1 hypothetical protein LPMP_331960 [Leishmania panamensis]
MGTSSIMSETLDMWDVYRLFCISAAAGADEGELQERLGIVEDYLTDYEALCHALGRALCTTHVQEIGLLVADEAEGRRFLWHNVEFLPWTLFVESSFAQVQALVAEQETAMRHSLLATYAASFTELLFPYEELLRMRLTWEALDSLALKACIVGRYGVREGQLARTSIPGYMTDSTFSTSASAATAAATVRDLLSEEHQERQEMVAARRQHIAGFLLFLASNEKHRSFTSTSVSGMGPLLQLKGNRVLTARQVLDGSATRIQSAYRGYRVRSVHTAPRRQRGALAGLSVGFPLPLSV